MKSAEETGGSSTTQTLHVMVDLAVKGSNILSYNIFIL